MAQLSHHHEHHLSKYFVVIGLIVFFGYVKKLHHTAFLILSGPCIYIAHGSKAIVSKFLISLPENTSLNFYGFLLPVMLVYYVFAGHQTGKILNERGPLRVVILLIFWGFLAYIHYLAYQNLQLYFVPLK